jgi:hypothetical protein
MTILKAGSAVLWSSAMVSKFPVWWRILVLTLEKVPLVGLAIAASQPLNWPRCEADCHPKNRMQGWLTRSVREPWLWYGFQAVIVSGGRVSGLSPRVAA